MDAAEARFRGRTLMVARSLEKADSFFLPSSSEVGFSFLPPRVKGRELLRFSALASFFSPFTGGVTSVVSAGTTAASTTSAVRGSVVSTAGMTGAVSATGSVASLGASTTGSAAFFLPKPRLPKMLHQSC